jgi:hypothetical protein
MKKVTLVLLTVVCLTSIVYGAERREPSRKASASSKEETPRTPKLNRVLNKSNPQTPKTPTSASNSPKLGRPSVGITNSGGETPKNSTKKVKSLKELQDEMRVVQELKNNQELNGSGEIKK